MQPPPGTSQAPIPPSDAAPRLPADPPRALVPVAGTALGLALRARLRGALARRVAPLVRLALAGLALALLLTLGRAVVVDAYLVPTGSMAPSIRPGDHIVVLKIAYGLRNPFAGSYVARVADPGVGDVILFSDPRGGRTPLVKRVVAVAGQSVACEDGVLFVDGVAATVESQGGRMIERIGSTSHELGARDPERFGPVVVPGDHVFVLGDDRAVSLDSRMMGAIPTSLVRGKVLPVVFRYPGAETEGGAPLLRAMLE